MLSNALLHLSIFFGMFDNNITTMCPESAVWDALQTVKDPEIPTISVVELGIVTSVQLDAREARVQVSITPTFTACPAIKIMQAQIHAALLLLDGVEQAEVVVDYSTPWTSNRMTERGRELIQQHGMAPPQPYEGELSLDHIQQAACPHCGSQHTSLHILFGATLCRSMHYCYDCQQSFEAFKPV